VALLLRRGGWWVCGGCFVAVGEEELIPFRMTWWPWIEVWNCEMLVLELDFHDEVVDERDVVSKPEMMASISLPFVKLGHV